MVVKTIMRNFFLNALKDKLNSKYLKDFPFVHISTIAGNVYGKIYNIFNDKMIILDNERTMISIEWKKIVFIELFKPP